MDTINAGVKTLHPEYEININKWSQIDHVISGSQAVKAEGECYLPKPGAAIDKCCPSREMYPNDALYNAAYAKWQNDKKSNDVRYEQYKNRALFYNLTKRTLDNYIGQVFRKKPERTIPTQLEYIDFDVDGSGNSVDQLAKEQVGQVSRKGRAGILVDIPENLGSRADQISGRLAPRMAAYKAENIINWKYKTVGASRVLTMVVLREVYEYKIDEFYSQFYYQYRVLRLDDNDLYVQDLYKFTDGDGGEKTTTEVKVSGQRIDYLPFYFMGSENNDFDCDDAPLYDLSEINIKHYQCSADNFESSHVVGQPTIHIDLGTQQNLDDFQRANPTGVSVGARSGLITQGGGTAQYLQASPNQMPKEDMRDLEIMAVQIGAALIQKSQQETAEAARIKHAADSSVISTIASNVSEAITDALIMCARFLGASEDDIDYQLNTDFETDQMDAQMLQAWMAGKLQGVIPTAYFNNKMRKVGYFPADATDEDIESLLENEGMGNNNGGIE